MKGSIKVAAVLAVLGAVAPCCNSSAQCNPGDTAMCGTSSSCFATCQANGTFGACQCGTDDAGPDVVAPDAQPDAQDAAPDAPVSPCSATPPTVNLGNAMVSAPTPTNTSTQNGYTLHMELDGFANYGATDTAADLVYTGQTAAWTFDVPAGSIASATIAVSLIADDSTASPAGGYKYDLWSGQCESATPTVLPHGNPPNTVFTNWVEVDEPAYPQGGAPFTVELSNITDGTSTNWIGIDWIELRVVTTQ